MVRDRFEQRRWGGDTFGMRPRATIGEAAASEQLIERRHLSRNGGQPFTAFFGVRQRSEQQLRVRMQRPREKFLRLRDLDDLAGVHQRDPMRDFADDAEIVRDQQHRHPLRLLQFDQQLENLLLDRDVERGRGLVGDQHVGLGRERDRDHHALLLAAGELERIAVDAPMRLPAGRRAAAIAVPSRATRHLSVRCGARSLRRFARRRAAPGSSWSPAPER